MKYTHTTKIKKKAIHIVIVHDFNIFVSLLFLGYDRNDKTTATSNVITF